MIFHWILSYSKSPQVSRTLLSIHADLNHVVIWTDSTRPLISKASSPCTNHLVTVTSVLITIHIPVTFIFHSFFSVLVQGLGTYLSFCFPSVLSCGQPDGKLQYSTGSILFYLLSLGLVVCRDRWSLCFSKSQRNLCILFSNFFQLPSKVLVFILLFIFFQFYSVVNRDSKDHNFASSLLLLLLLLLIIIRSGRLAEIRYPVCILKSDFVCFTLQDRFWVVHIPFFRMVKFFFFFFFFLLLLLLLLLLFTH